MKWRNVITVLAASFLVLGFIAFHPACWAYLHWNMYGRKATA